MTWFFYLTILSITVPTLIYYPTTVGYVLDYVFRCNLILFTLGTCEIFNVIDTWCLPMVTCVSPGMKNVIYLFYSFLKI